MTQTVKEAISALHEALNREIPWWTSYNLDVGSDTLTVRDEDGGGSIHRIPVPANTLVCPGLSYMPIARSDACLKNTITGNLYAITREKVYIWYRAGGFWRTYPCDRKSFWEMAQDTSTFVPTTMEDLL